MKKNETKILYCLRYMYNANMYIYNIYIINIIVVKIKFNKVHEKYICF